MQNIVNRLDPGAHNSMDTRTHHADSVTYAQQLAHLQGMAKYFGFELILLQENAEGKLAELVRRK